MWIASAATSDTDPRAAVSALADALPLAERGPPDFLALHINATYSVEAVRACAGHLAAKTLHGATSCLGVMTESGLHGGNSGGMGCLALWDAAGDYGTACLPLGQDPMATAAAATRQALQAAGRQGEAPELVWLTASPGCEEAVLAGIESVVGKDTPILGGSAADNDVSGQWKVFDGATGFGDGVAISVLFPSQPLSHSFQTGYVPNAHQGTVTRAAGRRLFEIDGQPAAEVYASWSQSAAGTPTDRSRRDLIADGTYFPLGREAGRLGKLPVYLLAQPAGINADGSLDLHAGLETGDRLVMMQGNRDYLRTRATRIARFSRQDKASSDTRKSAGLMIFCATCMLAIRDRMGEIAKEVSEAFGGGPFLAVFSFGEQGTLARGTNRHGNLMISCMTFTLDDD
ncbi:MAG: FIST N-terminal domain-containing protein [Rhodospirillales bacterium]